MSEDEIIPGNPSWYEARITKLLEALDEIASSVWVAQTCPEAAQIARMAREVDQKMTEK